VTGLSSEGGDCPCPGFRAILVRVSQPGAADIRRQLDRIAASAPFSGSDRMTRLLRYLVDRTLSGEGDQLKEYVLGVEVFDRDQRYDPRLDSIVRVEARRLRAKLEEYYQGPGAEDAIRISIPKGTYVPVFAAVEVPMAAADAPPVEPAAAPPPPASTAPPSAVSFKGSVAVGLLALTVVLLVAGAGWRPRSSDPVVEASASKSIAVLPFGNYSGRSDETQLAARLTDGVTTELARLRTLSVVSHTSALQFAGARASLRDIAKVLGADVVMEASVAVEGGTVVVETRLVNGATVRKFWVNTFHGQDRDLRALQRQIAGEVAAAAIRGTPHFPQ
jgi:TolB-like protein